MKLVWKKWSGITVADHAAFLPGEDYHFGKRVGNVWRATECAGWMWRTYSHPEPYGTGGNCETKEEAMAAVEKAVEKAVSA